MKALCIYHGNCADGFGAAWSVRNALGEEKVEFHAATYGVEPPDVSGRDVIMVDFSYKKDVMEKLRMTAQSILVLDHHKTAEEELKTFAKISETLDEPKAFWSFCADHTPGNDPCPIAVLFDMSRSGAGIAWDFFHPGIERPSLINHIEDRDLWRFWIFKTREVQAALFSYSYDFKVWDELMHKVPQLAIEGTAIERKHFKDIHELLAQSTRKMTIAGKEVPVANLPYTMSSDAGHILAKDQPFAACYQDTTRGRVFSLRSSPGGDDVSVVAATYGGGGHKHAAGFTMPVGWEGE